MNNHHIRHRLFPIICWVRLWRTLITVSREEGFEIVQPQLAMKKPELKDGDQQARGAGRPKLAA